MDYLWKSRHPSPLTWGPFSTYLSRAAVPSFLKGRPLPLLSQVECDSNFAQSQPHPADRPLGPSAPQSIDPHARELGWRGVDPAMGRGKDLIPRDGPGQAPEARGPWFQSG